LLRDDLFEGVSGKGWIIIPGKTGSISGSSESLSELDSPSSPGDDLCSSGRVGSLDNCLAGGDVSTGLLELISFSVRCDEIRGVGSADFVASGRFPLEDPRRDGAMTSPARSLGSGTRSLDNGSSLPALV